MNNILDSEMIENWNGSGCPSGAILTKHLYEQLDDAISQEINGHNFTCASCRAFCEILIEQSHKKVRREKK
jgi:hypothetical protein